MIEIEVYAAGVRDLEKVLELDHQLDAVPGLHYKVDSNHDIVYMEFEQVNISLDEIKNIFRDLGLTPHFVGVVPAELRSKSKTQPLG